MPNQHWYIHIHSQTYGPLSHDLVVLMLTQNRLQFADFIWRDGNRKWMRVGEMEDFSALMPAYPKVPIPNKEAGVEQVSLSPATPPNQAKVRRYPRVPISANAVLPEQGSFEVHNISEGGLYLKTSGVLPPLGTHLVFQLESGEFSRSFEMSGLVARFGAAIDPPGFALQFTRLEPEARKAISDYVHSQIL